MKNRENINRKLDILEGHLINLKSIVNTQQPVQTYLSLLDKSYDLVNEIKSFIELEPTTPNEINRY